MIHMSLFQEHLLNLSFYLDRGADVVEIRRRFRELLGMIASTPDPDYYRKLLVQLTYYTRDIQCGKGERLVSYHLLYEWYPFSPEVCLFVLHSFLFLPWHKRDESPYGGWRDLRDLAQVFYQLDGDAKHPVIQYCVFAINAQLQFDLTKDRPLSNAAKWVPRERPKWQWLFHELAQEWDTTGTKSQTSMYRNYRKVCSHLNRQIGTAEIDLCENRLPLVETMSRGAIEKYMTKYPELAIGLATRTYSNGFYGFRYDPRSFIKWSKILPSETVNSLWEATIRQQKYVYGSFGHILPIVDTHLFMTQHTGAPLQTALGLALGIAESSELGKRIMMMGHNPAWVRIPDEDSFSSVVERISQCAADNTTHSLEKCIRLLIQSFRLSQMTDAELEKTCLVLLSDMHFPKMEDTLHDYVLSLFSENGVPIEMVPHIVYWGVHVHEQSLVPCKPTHIRTTLLSGTNSTGFAWLQNLVSCRNSTAYDRLVDRLHTPRYFF